MVRDFPHTHANLVPLTSVLVLWELQSRSRVPSEGFGRWLEAGIILPAGFYQGFESSRGFVLLEVGGGVLARILLVTVSIRANA